MQDHQTLKGTERQMDVAQIMHIGLSSWIIQDGNYDDFAVGQQARFALEFCALQGLHRVTQGPARADHAGASRYRVRGRVVLARPNVWVVDTGLCMAFQEQQPPNYAEEGGWVEGEVYLGIDPFFYFEYLHRLEGMPPLTYTWHVKQIMQETTPWINTKDAEGRPWLARDKDRESFVAIDRTDAWHDDNGSGHYVLGCLRIAGPDRP